MAITRSSAELDALRGEVRQWLAEVISRPYGGPGFQRSGPICPYTGPAAANGELLVEVHEGLDGSDRLAVRDFIADSVNCFCATRQLRSVAGGDGDRAARHASHVWR